MPSLIFEPNEKMLLAQLADGSDVIGRLEAVEALGRKKNKLALEQLSKALAGDVSKAFRETDRFGARPGREEAAKARAERAAPRWKRPR